MEPEPLVVEAQSLHHWTAREVPMQYLLKSSKHTVPYHDPYSDLGAVR